MALLVKNPPANAGDGRDSGSIPGSGGFDPWVRKILWRRAWQPIPGSLRGESHEKRSLADYSLWDCKELDMTEAT